MDANHPFYQKLQNSNNILLVKDDVGKAKKSVRDLPSGEHCYGSKLKKDSESAGAVISSWQEHRPTLENLAEKDFKKLNKMSLENKLITPKQVSHFVKENDVRIKEKKTGKDLSKNIPDEYFGVPNKPGTPIDKVVSNGYGNLAATEKKKAYEASLQNKPTKQKDTSRIPEKSPTPEEKKEFKMKKFQSVQSKLKKSLQSK